MSNVVLTSELGLGFNLDQEEKKINAVTASALLVVSPDSPDEFNLQVYGNPKDSIRLSVNGIRHNRKIQLDPAGVYGPSAEDGESDRLWVREILKIQPPYHMEITSQDRAFSVGQVVVVKETSADAAPSQEEWVDVVGAKSRVDAQILPYMNDPSDLDAIAYNLEKGKTYRFYSSSGAYTGTPSGYVQSPSGNGFTNAIGGDTQNKTGGNLTIWGEMTVTPQGDVIQKIYTGQSRSWQRVSMNIVRMRDGGKETITVASWRNFQRTSYTPSEAPFNAATINGNVFTTFDATANGVQIPSLNLKTEKTSWDYFENFGYFHANHNDLFLGEQGLYAGRMGAKVEHRVIWVDSVDGSDTAGDGTKNKPFRTIQRINFLPPHKDAVVMLKANGLDHPYSTGGSSSRARNSVRVFAAWDEDFLALLEEHKDSHDFSPEKLRAEYTTAQPCVINDFLYERDGEWFNDGFEASHGAIMQFYNIAFDMLDPNARKDIPQNKRAMFFPKGGQFSFVNCEFNYEGASSTAFGEFKENNFRDLTLKFPFFPVQANSSIEFVNCEVKALAPIENREFIEAYMSLGVFERTFNSGKEPSPIFGHTKTARASTVSGSFRRFFPNSSFAAFYTL